MQLAVLVATNLQIRNLSTSRLATLAKAVIVKNIKCISWAFAYQALATFHSGNGALPHG
jgi:hypothetical protein